MNTWLKNRWVLGLTVAAGIVIGAVGSWWVNRPAPPWLEFPKLQAYYTLGSKQITTDGEYTVNRECYPIPRLPADSGEQLGEDRVIWRYEAIATDGQIAIYGPKPPAPSFSVGFHRYSGAIPLLETINVDGWVVRILITCPGETPETVASPPARVQVRG